MAREWDKVSTERLKGVHPKLRLLAGEVLQRAPWPIRVTEGLRTLERQKQLLAIKATKTLNSRHLTRPEVSIRSSRGSAYLARLAVNTTTSKRGPTCTSATSHRTRLTPFKWSQQACD